MTKCLFFSFCASSAIQCGVALANTSLSLHDGSFETWYNSSTFSKNATIDLPNNFGTKVQKWCLRNQILYVTQEWPMNPKFDKEKPDMAQWHIQPQNILWFVKIIFVLWHHRSFVHVFSLPKDLLFDRCSMVTNVQNGFTFLILNGVRLWVIKKWKCNILIHQESLVSGWNEFFSDRNWSFSYVYYNCKSLVNEHNFSPVVCHKLKLFVHQKMGWISHNAHKENVKFRKE